MDDLEKYVLEQAKIEVEHTRSWPTKILAFYVAINAGIVSAVFSLANRTPPVTVSASVKLLLSGAMLAVLIWAIFLLTKNHKNYLCNRNLQVHFQNANADALEAKFPVPPEWRKLYEVSIRTRWSGWGFYAFLLCLVAILTIAGLYVR